MGARIRQGRPVRRERGAALLTVMVTVAVLTALAVELAYSSRVSLQIAANARDELRGSYAARSGVALARLVLSFQQQLDGTAGLGGGAAGLAGSLPIPRVQLWNLVPVGSSLAEGLFPGARRRRGRGRSGARRHLRREDRGRGAKVNAQLEGYDSTGDLKLWQRTQALYQLVCDARWDPLFDREDAKGNKTTRDDLLVRLHDWVDTLRAQASALAVAGSTAASCGLVVEQPPFGDAFGDREPALRQGRGPVPQRRTPAWTPSTSSTSSPGSATPSWRRSGTT